jgi:hypothetical protein
MFFDVVSSSIVFQLDRFSNQRVNDGFMIFFDVVLLDVSFILCSLSSQEINSVALLQNGIALVLFILKHALNRFCMPLGCTIPVLHAKLTPQRILQSLKQFFCSKITSLVFAFLYR